jgi:exodeoxyribonuclease VII large subunit
MSKHLKLSDLLVQIQETIHYRFDSNGVWLHAQIMNVKKQPIQKRCYLTLEEYEDGVKTADVKAVFWGSFYHQIEQFEKATNLPFADGLKIICKAKVKFHIIYGLSLEIIQIDLAHTIGTLALERQITLDKLIAQNPNTIKYEDGQWLTHNNQLPLAPILKNIALITAPNSDGQQDFLKELLENEHGYTFYVRQYTTTIQGEGAAVLILEQLKLIQQATENKANLIKFDVVAIVRGGGSQADFLPFDNFELAQAVANFNIPIVSGIGHDRNTSIVDCMARARKTPTKAAAMVIDHNFKFENRLVSLYENMQQQIAYTIERANQKLDYAKKIIKLASPNAILKRGFAIVKQNQNIITNADFLNTDSRLTICFDNDKIDTVVTKIVKDEKGFKL